LNKPKGRPIVLFALALWLFWGFGYQTVWRRLLMDVEGTVISARDVTSPLAPSRRGTEYVILSPAGRTIHYIAGATDASLSRDIPIGAHIKKQQWQLSYEQDGQRIDFPTPFYVVMLSIAVGIVVWGGRLKVQELP
jgi:hypothetical protein